MGRDELQSLYVGTHIMIYTLTQVRTCMVHVADKQWNFSTVVYTYMYYTHTMYIHGLACNLTQQGDTTFLGKSHSPWETAYTYGTYSLLAGPSCKSLSFLGSG